MNRRRLAGAFFLACSALVFAACSDASTRSSSTSATDAGDAQAPPDATREPSTTPEASASSIQTNVSGAFTARGATFEVSRSAKGEGILDMILADAENVCGTPRSERFTNVLHLTVRAPGELAPGAFAIVSDTVMGGSGPAPQGTAVLWLVYDVGADLCSLSNTASAASGTVTLTRVTATSVEGTLDLMLRAESDGGGAGSGNVHGSFAAQPCVAPKPGAFACALGI